MAGKSSTEMPAAGRPLVGQVAVVAGATRGAGRGIALGLGEAGATVYCTGRSVRGNLSAYQRPETIDETAERVTTLGGQGIPLRVDHAVPAEVDHLFARVRAEQGRLDILVNSLGGEDPTQSWDRPLVEFDIDAAERLLRNSLLTHLLTTRHAVPLMIEKQSGLIVEVTEGDMLMSGMALMHGFVKTSLKVLAYLVADELRAHRITAVSVTPGFLRSESMLAHFGVTEANWREGGKQDPHFLESETPLYLGRGIAALAADPDRFARTGEVTSSWELADRYSVRDADGSQPHWGRHWQKIVPEIEVLAQGLPREVAWLEHLLARDRQYGAGLEALAGSGRSATTSRAKKNARPS